MKLLSGVPLLVTPWTAAHQAPPSMGFSRQEYWSGVPLPSLMVRLTFFKQTVAINPVQKTETTPYKTHLLTLNPGGENGNPLQFSCLEIPMDRGAGWATVHGVAKSPRLSDFPFTFHFHALEKEMAIHSGVLAWSIPGTGRPGGLPSMGLHRVGHN